MTTFRINYSSPAPRVESASDWYQGYNLIDALYDFSREETTVSVLVGQQVLGPWRSWIVPYTAREFFEIANKLLVLPSDGDDLEWIRESTPGLPPGAKAYCAVFADFQPAIVLAFATDGRDVWIYRGQPRQDDIAKDGLSFPRFAVSSNGTDDDAPIKVSRQHVLDEVRAFLTRYLDDAIVSFPFLRGEPKYEHWRSRLGDMQAFAGIPGPHPSRPEPEPSYAPPEPPGKPMDDPRVLAALADLEESLKKP